VFNYEIKRHFLFVWTRRIDCVITNCTSGCCKLIFSMTSLISLAQNNILKTKKKTVKTLSVQCSPSIRNNIALLKGSQASPACYHKRSNKMDMSVGHRWSGTNIGKPKYWE